MAEASTFESPLWFDGSRWLVRLPADWSVNKKGDVFEFSHVSGNESFVLGVSKAAGSKVTALQHCFTQARTELFSALYSWLPKEWQLSAHRVINPLFLFTSRHPALGRLLGRFWCALAGAKIRQRSFGLLTGCVLERSVAGKFVAEGYLGAMEWRFWVRYIAIGGPEMLTHGSAHNVLSAIRLQESKA
jgi:hypothetical protein